MVYEVSDKLKFINKMKSLNKEQLAELFEQLKAEEAPLGMIMAVSKEYATRR